MQLTVWQLPAQLVHNGFQLLSICTGMTLSALRLREREPSFPDLSISILLFSPGAFAEHIFCTGPYTRHWKYWEPDSPWRSFSQVQSVNMWEYLTTGWDKIEWRISEGGKNKYEWKTVTEFMLLWPRSRSRRTFEAVVMEGAYSKHD